MKTLPNCLLLVVYHQSQSKVDKDLIFSVFREAEFFLTLHYQEIIF